MTRKRLLIAAAVVMAILILAAALIRANPAFLDGVIRSAAAAGHYRGVQICLLLGADANGKAASDAAIPQITPLHFAAFNGDVDIARYLVKRGADVNAADEKGWTPLHWAASGGPGGMEGADTLLHADTIPPAEQYEEMVRLLLDRGGNVGACDDDGGTPLHRAASGGHTGILEILITYGGDPNHSMANGCTPLHSAARGGHLDVAQLLLSKGVDVNAVTDRKRTPLHWAAEAGHGDIVKLLIANGADATAQDNEGKTPLDLAYSEDVKALLRAQTPEPKGEK